MRDELPGQPSGTLKDLESWVEKVYIIYSVLSLERMSLRTVCAVIWASRMRRYYCESDASAKLVERYCPSGAMILPSISAKLCVAGNRILRQSSTENSQSELRVLDAKGCMRFKSSPQQIQAGC